MVVGFDVPAAGGSLGHETRPTQERSPELVWRRPAAEAARHAHHGDAAGGRRRRRPARRCGVVLAHSGQPHLALPGPALPALSDFHHPPPPPLPPPPPTSPPPSPKLPPP